MPGKRFANALSGKDIKLSGAQKKKLGRVLREFAEGRLRSGSGKKITDKRQAMAIAFSEARKHRG